MSTSRRHVEDVRRIYLGSVLLQLDDPSGACKLLETIDSRLVPEPWKSEARWALALGLERTGRRQSADSIFAVLAAESGSVAERARAHLHARP